MQIYRLYQQNMQKICTKYARNMHKFASNMQLYAKNKQLCAQNMHKYANIQTVLVEYAKDMYKICPKYA